uniref:GGDEF domain-containing protein n=1 Tax=candidate division WOR-3 bacterium TaxID=2052148 RepID=A0A7C4Y517_UNCW3
MKRFKNFIFVLPLIAYLTLIFLKYEIKIPFRDYLILFVSGLFILSLYFFKYLDFLTSLFILSSLIEIFGGASSPVFLIFVIFFYLELIKGDFMFFPSLIPLISILKTREPIYALITYGIFIPIYFINRKIVMEKNKFESIVNDVKKFSIGMKEKHKEEIKSMIENKESKIPMTLFELYYNSLFKICESIHDAVLPTSTCLFIKNKEDGFFYLKFAKSSLNVIPDAKIDKGPLTLFYNSEVPVILDDYSGSSKNLSYYDKDYFIKSIAAYPIIPENEVEGIILLDSRKDFFFNEEKKNLILLAKKEIELLIRFYRYTEASMIEAVNFSIIQALTNKISTELERDKIINSCFEALKDIYPDTNQIIFLRSADEFLIIESDGRRYLKNIEDGIIGTAIKNNLTLKKDNMKEEIKRPFISSDERDFNIVSFIFAPFRGNVEGGIAVYSNIKNRFKESELSMLSVITDIMDTGLEKAALYEKEKRRASRDGLTGLYNHRFFQEFLQKQIEKSKRDKKVFSLLFIDIDNFKKFNDRYGHLAGDYVLKEIANVINGSIRSSDIAARYGGEEIAVILPETDDENALRTAEKIRRNIESHSIILNEQNEAINITVSIGTSSYKEGFTKEDLISLADKALYQAKSEGKNRVVKG